MEEQVESKSREEIIRETRNKIRGDMTPHILVIKKLLDALTELTSKDNYKDADNDEAFEIMDGIREEQDAIEELLFNLRDTIR